MIVNWGVGGRPSVYLDETLNFNGSINVKIGKAEKRNGIKETKF